MLLSVLIRIFFIANGLDVADISNLHLSAEAMLKGSNPYLLFNFAIYPPISYYIVASILFLSNFLEIPFHILIKILPNLADILITLVLYKFLIKLNVVPIRASLWSLIYFLNPISIIISAAHGQLDSITSLLVLLSIYILSVKSKSNQKLLAPLLIGLAIAIKPNPAMLLPFFLVYKKGEVKQGIIFLLISATPAIITLAPYIWQSPQAIITNVFNYSGVYDFSFAAVLRGLWYQQNAHIWLPIAEKMLGASKLVFVLGISLLLFVSAGSRNLSKTCLTVYLLFLGIYFGISAQYLIWILPFAVLTREKMIIPFSVFGTVALFGFYSFFGPEILYGRFWHGAAFQSKYMLIYFIGNLLLWITIMWWLIKIIKEYLHSSFQTFSSLHKKLVILTLSIFIFSMIPVLQLVFNLFSQMTNP